MELKEILLLIAVVIILLAAAWLRKIQTPRMNYVRLCAALLLIVLVWAFSDAPIALRVVMTLVASGMMYRAFMSLRNHRNFYKEEK